MTDFSLFNKLGKSAYIWNENNPFVGIGNGRCGIYKDSKLLGLQIHF